MNTLGEKVKALRDLNGTPITEFAKNLGITVERLEEIETNQELPNVRELWEMVRKYDVKMSYFIDLKGEK